MKTILSIITFLIANSLANAQDVKNEVSGVTVTYGAENDIIPEMGKVEVEKFSNDDRLKCIRFRDSAFYYKIEFDNKTKVSETKFPLDSLYNKYVFKYHPNGTVRLKAFYRKGFLYGNFVEYHENGMVKQIGYYTDKLRKNGVWKYYSLNGDLIKSEEYDAGKLK